MKEGKHLYPKGAGGPHPTDTYFSLFYMTFFVLFFSLGDDLDILLRDDNGWWYGALNGQRGHFPATYVQELPVLNENTTSDA